MGKVIFSPKVMTYEFDATSHTILESYNGFDVVMPTEFVILTL